MKCTHKPVHHDCFKCGYAQAIKDAAKVAEAVPSITALQIAKGIKALLSRGSR